MWLPLIFLSNFLLQIIAASKLSSGVNPNDDALLSDNSALSVYMPRKHRQTTSDNDVSTDVVQINKFDVNCDLPKDRVTVTVEFLQPFNGIIYSKGFRDDPGCNYIPNGSGEKVFTFSIPTKGCGTRLVKCKQRNCGFGNPIENILIIQQDDFVTEINDLARRVTCFTVSPNVATLSFKPIMVDMLDVVTIPIGGETVECWMDIQRGQYPNLTPVGDLVKIGEPLTVLISVVDHSKIYDARIHECWAYNSEDYYNKNTKKVLLTDINGCPKKKNLISFWSRKREPEGQGVKITAYNTLTGFKFSDSDKVFLTCNIELCKGECTEQCGEETTSKFGSTPAQISSLLSGGFNCYPGTNDPRCISTVTITSTESFNERKVHTVSTSTPLNPLCYPGSPNPQCSTSTASFQPTEGYLPPSKSSEKPLKCYFGSTDPRCPKIPLNVSLSAKPQTTFLPLPALCYPGSPNPRCLTFSTPSSLVPSTSFPPSLPSTISTSPKPICFPGLNDSRCLKLQPITPEYLPPSSTPEQSVCYPGSPDPKCALMNLPSQLLPKSICSVDFTDPRCSRPLTSLPTLPPSLSSVPPKPICYPGSNDFRCIQVPSQRPTPILPFSLPPSITSTSPKPICYPDSNDIRCSILKPVTPESRPPALTRKPQICYPGSSDPRCTTSPPPSSFQSKPVCYIGSPDPRCPQLSPQSSPPPPLSLSTLSSSFPSPTNPVCYPGSEDFRCLQILSQPPPSTLPPSILSTSPKPICYPGSNDIQCLKLKPITAEYLPPSSTIKPLTCYLGSSDPRCLPSRILSPSSSSTTTLKPICYAGSLDPRCRQLVLSSVPPSPSSLPLKPICYPGSNDFRCPQIQLPAIPSAVYASPSPPLLMPSPQPPSSPVNFICLPNSSDPRCILSKYPPSIYIPPSSTFKPSRPPFCYPGSNDPRCEKPRPLTPEYLPPITSTIKPLCFPGSTDPLCLKSRPNSFSSSLPSSTPKPNIYIPLFPSLCYSNSNDSRCSKSEPTSPSSSLCHAGSLDPRCPKSFPTTTPKSTVSVPSYPPICFPGSPDLRCPHLDPTPPTSCYPGSFDPRCPKLLPSSTPKSVTSIPLYPLICYPGSPDLRCSHLNSAAPQSCYPGSSSPNCLKRLPSTTPKPVSSVPSFPSVCSHGYPDFRCSPQATTLPSPPTSSFVVPSISSSSSYLKCYPGNNDPRCLKPFVITTLKPAVPVSSFPSFCFPGSTASNCLKPLATESLRPATPLPTFPSFCYPGSNDPKCPQSNPTSSPSLTPSAIYPISISTIPSTPSVPVSNCYPGSPDPRCKPPLLHTLVPQSICYPGSNDFRCPKISTPTQTPSSSKPTLASSSVCSPSSTDPTCFRPSSTLPYPKPNCSSGSIDVRCLKLSTSFPPTLNPVISTTSIPICYPGTKDPRCPLSSSPSHSPLPLSPAPVSPIETSVVCFCNGTTARPIIPPICHPESTDPRCTATKLPSSCYPGSPDPRCPQPGRPANPKPPIGYLPPDDNAERKQSGELLKRQSTNQRQIVLQALNDLKREVQSEVNNNEDINSLNQLVDDLYDELQKEKKLTAKTLL